MIYMYFNLLILRVQELLHEGVYEISFVKGAHFEKAGNHYQWISGRATA